MIGRSSHYKAVTIGNSLGNTEEQAFTYLGNCLKPFAPVHVSSKRAKDHNNITISWIRRARLNNDWRDNVDIALGEESEQYQIDILDTDHQVIRTIETSTSTALYAAADQLADFKRVPKTITIKIYQISAVIGRGHETIATI
jgi:hypothetical protein